MEKFSKEFYASRIEDWKTKYIKVKELLKLTKSIQKDIEKNGGQIIKISSRKTIYLDEFRPSIISAPLDRHSVGLGVLEGTEGLFNKNQKIFNTPLMYEINEIFKELENLEYCDDIKIFLYFLSVEVHNVYVFYLSIEKNIFMRVNEHSYSRQKYSKMNKEELLEELADLTDITYLMYSFYSYIDLNIEAIHEILKYFDDHFQILNHDLSMDKLFFRRNLSKKESDLKYILSFKIIIESSALIESYYHEILKINNSKEIKTQIKELKEVLSYLIEKNTDRVNDDIYEVYLKQKRTRYNNIIKQKKNIDIEIHNSYFIDQQEDYYKRLGEKQYDEEINIKTTKRNIINLILLYLHTFLYSFFYIMPYLSFYFYFLKNNITEFFYLGSILTITHLGNLISRIIINFTEKYKIKYIIFCICFLLSFALIIVSQYFLQKDDIKMFIILNLISRFIYGFSCGRLITRKYIMLYLPESEIKYYSLIYIIIVYMGILFGVIINYLSAQRESFKMKWLPFYIDNHLFLFASGFFICIIYLFFFLFLFTEPTEKTMIKQNRNTISTKDETSKDSIDKNIYECKDDDRCNDSENNENGFYNRSYNKENKNDSDSNNTNNSSKEISNKTFNEKNYKLNIDKIDSRSDTIKTKDTLNKDNNNKNDILNSPLNLALLQRESDNDKDDNVLYKKNTISDDLMSAEEIKGLNSIEKDIIELNTKNNYNDVNLLPEELDRIKKNQFKSNKSYLCSFLVFIISLLLTNSLKEYIILSIPLYFLRTNKFDDEISIVEKEVIISITVLEIFSFPFIIFFRMMKTFNIERRLLLIFYLFLNILIISFSLIKYLFYQDINEETYSFKNVLYRIGTLIIFIISNFIEGTTNLLSYKIIPSFVKICHINNKYLISYSVVIGKILGGIIYSILCLLDYYSGDKEKDEEEKISPFGKTNIFKIGTFIFCGFSFFSFFVFCICYKSLRVRAISKLFYINE